MKRILTAICAFTIAIAYAMPYYQPHDSYPLDSKPYVYRALSAWIISLLQWLGLSYETATLLLIGASGVLFVLAFERLLEL